MMKIAAKDTQSASSGLMDSMVSNILSFHRLDFIHVKGGLVPHQGNQNAQGNGHLGGRNRDHEYREYLPPEVLEKIGEGHKIDIDRVEDQLHRHQDDQDISSQKDACSPDDKEESAQDKVPG